ncbi:MAG: hypothetical protein AAGN15_05385 [Cyanobacteria bacterium J06581_3]
MAQQPVDIDYKSILQTQLLQRVMDTLPIGLLKDLLRLTQQGNLQKLCQELAALEEKDSNYRSFAISLFDLAKQLQTEAIEQILLDYLEQQPIERLLVES